MVKDFGYFGVLMFFAAGFLFGVATRGSIDTHAFHERAEAFCTPRVQALEEASHARDVAIIQLQALALKDHQLLLGALGEAEEPFDGGTR